MRKLAPHYGHDVSTMTDYSLHTVLLPWPQPMALDNPWVLLGAS